MRLNLFQSLAIIASVWVFTLALFMYDAAADRAAAVTIAAETGQYGVYSQ